MSTTPQNQIQTLVSLQQAKCADIWTKHGLSLSERHDKLEEFKRMLQSTYDDFTQEQIQEATDLENDIGETREQIKTQLSRLGMTMPLPPLTGSLKEQYNTTTEKSQEILEKVKMREKEVFALTTSIRKLSNQLNQPVPPNCSIETDGTSDLSHQFMTSLQQIESELGAQVEKNLGLLHESLPYLIYYLKEMNLYSELGWIYQSSMKWEEQGEYIRGFSHMIGMEVSEVLSSSYQFTEFDNIIQQRVNLTSIPSVKEIQQQNQGGRNCDSNSVSATDTAEIFSHYSHHLDYSQFPIEVQFIKELQHKVMQLQIMYRERSDFSLEIGDKIRNLWELTSTSAEETSAWTESRQDLSMITLRTFQIELIRLCEKKAALLPEWVANHEKMLSTICKQLGLAETEIQTKLQFCRSQYTQDDQLETLRVELNQLRAELAVRQPILDAVTQFSDSCSIVDKLKELDNHPDRFKDAKIRKQLDQLRKECRVLPQKAAQLYRSILAFENDHGELLTSGQRLLTVLEQNEFWEQARKGGLLIGASRGVPGAKGASTGTGKVSAMPSAPTSKLNTTRTGPSVVLRPAEDSKLNQSKMALGQKPRVPGTAMVNKVTIPGTKPTVTAALARGAASRPGLIDSRRRSKEMQETVKKARAARQ